METATKISSSIWLRSLMHVENWSKTYPSDQCGSTRPRSLIYSNEADLSTMPIEADLVAPQKQMVIWDRGSQKLFYSQHYPFFSTASSLEKIFEKRPVPFEIPMAVLADQDQTPGTQPCTWMQLLLKGHSKVHPSIHDMTSSQSSTALVVVSANMHASDKC